MEQLRTREAGRGEAGYGLDFSIRLMIGPASTFMARHILRKLSTDGELTSRSTWDMNSRVSFAFAATCS